MVKKVNLAAKLRDAGSKPKKLRNSGLIPAVIYGNETENKSIQIKSKDILKAYEEAGESTLVDLEIEGKEKIPVIIKDIQFDPIKNKIIHADFYKVNMKEELEVEIPLTFINDSKAVKELGGTLVRNLESLNVRCLPNELIERLDVDISSLSGFDDAIYVKDLKVPGKIEVLNDPEEVIANISAPAAEEKEEEAPAEESADAEKDKNSEVNKEESKESK
jgi:large subunit ribosomal protein L25